MKDLVDRITRDELLKILAECLYDPNQEVSHVRADEALLAFINDPEIATAFYAIPKWYA